MHLPEKSSGDYEQTPAGTHTAICYRFIDIGTHKTEYQGQTKTQRKILLGFELSNEMMEDGRPFTASKRYTWSMHDKATLRIDLEAWRGKKFVDADFGKGGFDIRNVLGKPCTINVVNDEKPDGKTFTNITSIGSLMKGMMPPKQINPTIYVSLDPEYFDKAAFDALSDGLKKTIMESPEWTVLSSPRPATYAQQTGAADPAREPSYERNYDPFNDDGPQPFAPLEGEDQRIADEVRNHPLQAG